MEPMIEFDGVRVFLGDCRDVLRELPDNSVDSIVTDPPYELGFMGKKWDSTGIAYDVTVWQECLRVLKPGGHILAFGGSRTWHRLAVAVEDAGFELRDSIAWLYGSGFPKSLDVSKAIDKTNAESGRVLRFVRWMKNTGLKARQIDNVLKERGLISPTSNRAVHYFNEGQPNIPTAEFWSVIRPMCGDVPGWVDELVARVEAEREVIGQKTWSNSANHFVPGENHKARVNLDETAPATPEAEKWQGWGTALKPAFEPIVVGRKPLVGTVAENVLLWGTGGLNIDGSRIASTGEHKKPFQPTNKDREVFGAQKGFQPSNAEGRWPANVILDEHTAELLDQQSGVSVSRPTESGGYLGDSLAVGGGRVKANGSSHCDSGGASRFFFVADTLTHSRIDSCENINANNVAKLLNTIRATIESSAQTNVEDSPNESNVHAVKNAGIQCDSCATHIAADLVALKTLASNEETSTHFHRSINDFGNSILNQNLVSFVEKWVSTDTIPTTTDFSTLFGCALLAIGAPTKLENLENDNGRSRFIYQAKASKRDRNEGLDGLEETSAADMVEREPDSAGMNSPRAGAGRTSGAKNFHPTVKPTQLMRYLIKLVTPPGGVVLDPFTGSGSTGKAAILDGFEFVGVELTEDYLPIIEGRLRWAMENRDEGTLF